jgi:hypothetical protein
MDDCKFFKNANGTAGKDTAVKISSEGNKI